MHLRIQNRSIHTTRGQGYTVLLLVQFDWAGESGEVNGKTAGAGTKAHYSASSALCSPYFSSFGVIPAISETVVEQKAMKEFLPPFPGGT